jgi:hypothetical protein
MSDLDLEIRPLAVTVTGRGGALEAIYDQPEQERAAAIRDDGSKHVAAAEVPDPLALRYDSFRYVYKPDFGRVVLIDQDPMSGEQISQIPSQRVLELYAEQRRDEARSSLMHGAADGTAASSASGSKRRMVSSQTGVSVSQGNSQTVVSPASLAAPTVKAQPVNITI